MFTKNKYTKWYFTIVHSAINRPISGYVEKHHIIPKSLGGSNDQSNLVSLTAREHFICHLLLLRMVTDIDHKRKMIYAAWQQSRSSKLKGGKVTSRIYEQLKKQLSELYTGRKRAPFSEQAKQNMKTAAKTRKKVEYSAERINKLKEMVQQSKGVSLSNEHKENIRAAMAGKSYEERYGIEKANELREKRRNQQLLRPTVTCPHCGKSGKGAFMNRYHFDNCKLLR
jgi:hypothetical protein